MPALPAWCTPDAESVAEEARRYVLMPEDERVKHLAAVCRAAMKLLALNPQRSLALAYRDPLPQSTVDALARLRRQFRAKRVGDR